MSFLLLGPLCLCESEHNVEAEKQIVVYQRGKRYFKHMQFICDVKGKQKYWSWKDLKAWRKYRDMERERNAGKGQPKLNTSRKVIGKLNTISQSRGKIKQFEQINPAQVDVIDPRSHRTLIPKSPLPLTGNIGTGRGRLTNYLQTFNFLLRPPL